jgi:hypothetical protein
MPSPTFAHSSRVIACSVGIGRTAVAEYIRRAAVIGITWPIPEGLDDTALERRYWPLVSDAPRNNKQRSGENRTRHRHS